MAKDPNSYSAVFATVGLADLTAETINLARKLSADGNPAQASLVRGAYQRLVKELESIAQHISGVAEKEILAAEASSRVRPDTGNSGPDSLTYNLGASHPLLTVPGSVGVNYEPDLVSWWWTNEEGYSGHVGREIKGFFQPSGDPPLKSQFRADSDFTPSRAGKKGIIRNPIPERRFVQQGAGVAEAQWHAEIRSAKARFIAEVERAVRSVPPPSLGSGKRPRRRRP